MSKPQPWVPLIPVVLSTLIGCNSRLPPTANPQLAREALEIGLEAWKSGQSPESLQARSPKIYFSDDLWNASVRLSKYAIRTEGVNGQGWRCDVQLTLVGKDGKSRDRISSYQIDTDPAIVIVQQP